MNLENLSFKVLAYLAAREMLLGFLRNSNEPLTGDELGYVIELLNRNDDVTELKAIEIAKAKQ